MSATIKAGMVGSPKEIDRLGALSPNSPAQQKNPATKGEFKSALDGLNALAGNKPQVPLKSDPEHPLKFSQHAIERMQTRGIKFDQETMARIEDAVIRAKDKGAKDTLILTDTMALVVSAKSKTVVTVMDRSMMKDNVFTNIDSTVFV